MGWQYLKILVAKWQRVKGLGGLSVIVNSGRCTCDDRVNRVTRTKTGDMAAASVKGVKRRKQKEDTPREDPLIDGVMLVILLCVGDK